MSFGSAETVISIGIDFLSKGQLNESTWDRAKSLFVTYWLWQSMVQLSKMSAQPIRPVSNLQVYESCHCPDYGNEYFSRSLCIKYKINTLIVKGYQS